ncbi:hypothetical protein MTR67_043885 [Solanum verrucosum]|uniref:Retrotransposon gag domain-containing protein n=1 Tax=Solanum verrucosum TaxID=315347 RepID=A0AAF0UPV4_SOLVR|nr:hypothetical protein MTR67_043885 [Solanum verrucosum]
MKEAKVLEFINLRQGNMSVKEYSLKFMQLSIYAPTMVADPRERMIKFVSGVSEKVVKECHTAMLINEMEISCLMIHAQQIEEEKLKERLREEKREKTGSYNAPNHKFNKDRVPKPKPQGGNGGGNGSSVPTCQKYGKSHLGKCMIGMDNYFSCGKSGHRLRDFPSRNDKKKDGRQAPPSGSGSSSPKQNQFYAL